jgi:hypothetical protein
LNWEALGAIAELLGAIGVIVTLIYLSVQIRQNNNHLGGAATTAVFEYQRTLTEMLSADTELYKIALRGNEDLASLDSWEQQRFTLWAIHETGMWEMCHRPLGHGQRGFLQGDLRTARGDPRAEASRDEPDLRFDRPQRQVRPGRQPGGALDG